MRMLLTEKERALHSAYVECDLEKLPLMSVSDIQIANKDDFNSFKGEKDFGIIGIVDSSHEKQEL